MERIKELITTAKKEKLNEDRKIMADINDYVKNYSVIHIYDYNHVYMDNLVELLKKSKSKLRDYKLPVIPSSYYVELKEAQDAIKEITKELDKKPIVIKILKHVLLISYTNEGVRSLEKEYRKQNGGILDNKVIFKTWYSFLLSELIKPYQCSLKLKSKQYQKEIPVTFPENFISSIAFYNTEPLPRWYNQAHVQYFVNRHGDIVPDRVSHLAYLCNDHSKGRAIARMSDIYSHIFVDELQDYAGWDLEIIRLLFESQMLITCVGDYKQATYRTNNSPKNSQYRDENVRNYFKMLERKGLCTTSYSNTTRRFNREICDFINTIHGDMESIVEPDRAMGCNDQTDNVGVYLMDNKHLSQYCEYYQPTILRYDKKAKIDFHHNCDVYNYGASKGATYERVVVVPVSTTLPFIQNQATITSNQTKSKFYVACTRAKHSIVFAVDSPKETVCFKSTEICIGNKAVPAYKFENVASISDELE